MTSTRDLLAIMRWIDESKPVILCHPDDFQLIQEAAKKDHLVNTFRFDTSPFVPKGTYYYINPSVMRADEFPPVSTPTQE